MKLLRAIILGAGLLFVSSSVFAGGACCAAKKDKTAGEGTAPVVASADAGEKKVCGACTAETVCDGCKAKKAEAEKPAE